MASAKETILWRIRRGTKDVPEGERPDDVAVERGYRREDEAPREEIVAHLREMNPDLLFFAGDQSYRHTEHTAGWIEFGLQFRDVMRNLSRARRADARMP